MVSESIIAGNQGRAGFTMKPQFVFDLEVDHREAELIGL
jgi:hypothetical protein